MMRINLKDSNKILHQLLLEDEAERAQAEAVNRKVDSSECASECEEAINSAFRKLGVLPMKDTDEGEQVWQRTIPSSLLPYPIISPPYTTLVPSSSLPRGTPHLQSLDNDDDGTTTSTDENDPLVEVCSFCPEDHGIESSTGSESKPYRPIPSRQWNGHESGTSRLEKYSRGSNNMAQRRPFISGLSNDQNEFSIDEGKTNGENDDDEHLSEEASESALEVIKKGSLASWKDGTLLTSPPGVSFKVGIDFNDVYNDIDAGEYGGNEKEELVDEVDDEIIGEKSSPTNVGTGEKSSRPVVNQIWDKTYFEEDSLFDDDVSESDSGGSGSSSDDESSNSSTGNNDVEIVKGTESESIKDGDDNNYTLEDESKDDDIEALLSDIVNDSQIENALKRNARKISLSAAARAENKDEASSTRKSWAVTTYLPSTNFHSVVENPAIKYPFELDEFQKQAVLRLERDECIFVAAHTSAGKTVCAEYAIALAKKHCTRAIYTSPIKALSNQKYRDFTDKFGSDVGLITGDMQVNPDASCLIMTTEILRSMLYRGADIVRDIEWVIFDECHYINDSERGVVWEEVIIMLPEYTKLIFLSATTPNTIEFSDWIGKTKRKPVNVIRTDYRPVPLSHHLYTNNGSTGQKLHLVKLGQGGFLEKGWKQASIALMPKSEREKKQQKKDMKGGMNSKKKPTNTPYSRSTGSKQSAWQQLGSRQDWTSLVKFLEREDKMPTVVFSFSKKKCEEIANMLHTLDLNSAAEKTAAHAFTVQTMGRLSPKDALLPQVINTCEMVKRGIGVHHGGLLPILKEMVELLFSRNLIKVLFATETFAMGVNMPAKAVVFNSTRKHDGTKFRVLEPGEYTQMAGRAGRRGLDSVGTVIICCFGEEPPPQLTLRNMLTGSSTKLQSKFRLTYNMILNLLKVEDMSVEGMIKRSFSEFATQRALTANEYPQLLKKGLKILAKHDDQFRQDADSRIGSEDIESYFRLSSALLSHNKDALSFILSCTDGNCGGALVPGRIVLVTAARKKNLVAAPAIIIKSPVNDKESKSTSCICIVLLPKTYVSPSDNSEESMVKESHLNYIGTSMSRHYAIYEIDFGEILLVSSIKHSIHPTSLYKEETSFTDPSFKSAKPLAAKKVDDDSDFFGGVQPRKKGKDTDDFFAGMQPRKKNNDTDDFFAGMVSRGKGGKKDNKVDDFFAGVQPRRGKKTLDTNTSQSQLDEVMAKLIKAEQDESECSLPILDLTGCLKRVQQVDSKLRFQSTFKTIQDLIVRMRVCQSHHSACVERHYKAMERKESLRATTETLRHLLSNESLQLFPDFLQRKALLKSLNYIDEMDTVCVKGRVACEVNTCEELIVTEMVFEGVLNDLDPAEIVACLSSLVFQEKSQDDEFDSELPESLKNTCMQMKTIAYNLGELQNQHGLQIDPKDYVEQSMKFGLVHVVYEWALGVPFSNICELTLVQEGSIVRCITRLDELCREVRNCARVVGNPTLYSKMEDASSSIKRDIVFASSLYIN